MQAQQWCAQQCRLLTQLICSALTLTLYYVPDCTRTRMVMMGLPLARSLRSPRRTCAPSAPSPSSSFLLFLHSLPPLIFPARPAFVFGSGILFCELSSKFYVEFRLVKFVSTQDLTNSLIIVSHYFSNLNLSTSLIPQNKHKMFFPNKTKNSFNQGINVRLAD